jgi:hypothetical protein
MTLGSWVSGCPLGSALAQQRAAQQVVELPPVIVSARPGIGVFGGIGVTN